MRILLLTLHSQNNNFGSVLQANSLYFYIKSLGYDVTILDYQPYYSNGALDFKKFLKKVVINFLFLPQFIRRTIHFNKFINSETTTKKYKKYEQLSEIVPEYDVFMIGSDQVWNPSYLCGNDPAYTLKFVDSNKKIAYGASIGTKEISESSVQKIASNIKEFKFVSLRERVSAIQLKNVGNIDAQYVLDPVFLFDVEYYRKIQKSSKNTGYILAYIIHKDPFIKKVVEIIASQREKKVIQIGGFAPKCNYDKFIRAAGPSEFLGLIDGADFVITSSFHGVAFSHIYHKQFAVVLPYDNTLRLTNILESAGTEDRIITNIKDIDNLSTPIDYKKVDERLEKMKKQSYDFLKFSLKKMEES